MSVVKCLEAIKITDMSPCPPNDPYIVNINIIKVSAYSSRTTTYVYLGLFL